MYNDSNFATNPLAVLPPIKEPHRYTLAEYLRREERSEELHEYLDGIIIKLPMAKTPHNVITANVAFVLKSAIRLNNKNYWVMTGQQLIYMPKLNYSRYPDVLVVCEAPLFYDKNEVLLLNPVLIVEVLSKGTRTYDRTSKFDEYKTIDTFKEYLLIDQKKCHIENRFREEPHLWRDTEYKDINGLIYLKSLDFSIEIADIYEKIVFKK
jgi:Uma2 family endonuclease